jgi:hypothetical protein
MPKCGGRTGLSPPVAYPYNTVGYGHIQWISRYPSTMLVYAEPALVPPVLPPCGWTSNELKQAQRAQQTAALVWIYSLSI